MISSGILEMFLKLKSVGKLPQEFEKFLVKDKDGDDACELPSIRSCVKAPEGWCFVESDYQTAEIRGLAFISGDQGLIDIICNPDLNFGVSLKGEPLRTGFPSDVFDLQQQEKFKHILTPVDSELLKRNDKGELMHPKQDLHWSLAEMVHATPRELLDEKKDRGAAKVGNFSCISSSSYVETLFGPKTVTNISLDDLLWDGVEWVSHEGIQYQGNRFTINYQGLSATPDHVVWLADGKKCCFGFAAINNLQIKKEQAIYMSRSKSKNASGKVPFYDAEVLQRHPRIVSALQRKGNKSLVPLITRLRFLGFREMAEHDLRRSRLRPDRQQRSLFKRELKTRNANDQYEEYKSLKMVISDESRGFIDSTSKSSSSYAHCLEFASNGEDGKRNTRNGKFRTAEKPSSYTEQRKGSESQSAADVLSSLRNKRETNIKVISSEYDGSRNNRTCKQAQRFSNKDKRSEKSRRDCFAESRKIGPRLCRQLCEKDGSKRIIRRPDAGRMEKSFSSNGVINAENREAWLVAQRIHYSQVDSEGDVGRSARRIFEDKGFKLTKEPVYDIINVGPRHRFVANNLLVSNSAYGASPATLERKIEQDTGKKPIAGVGDKLLKALEKRQPIAQDFLVKIEKVPAKSGAYRAASGRIRHFTSHGEKYLDILDEHLTTGLFRSMGREARNFP